VNAVSTQVAPTVNEVATQAAPTVPALQTQSVPTVNAVATELMPTVSAAATASAQSGLRVTGAQLTSGDPTITVQNTSDRMVDLSAWSLQIGSTSVHLPANTQVGPGKSLVIHASSGTNDSTDVYLGSTAQSAMNALTPGARVSLENPSGAPVASFTMPQS
jgi:hypothetical protein